MQEQRSKKPKIEEEKCMEEFTFKWFIQDFFCFTTKFESKLFTPLSAIPVKFRIELVRGSKIKDYEYEAYPLECNLLKCSDETIPKDLTVQCEVKLAQGIPMTSETHNIRDLIKLFTCYHKLPYAVFEHHPEFKIGSTYVSTVSRTLKVSFNFKFFNAPFATDQPNTCLDDFKSLYDSKEFSDVSICVGKDTLRAHKSILVARSPVFACKFVEKQTDCIDMEQNIDAGSVDRFLLYLYCGYMDNDVSFDALCNVYTLAVRYQVADLRKFCCNMIIAKLSLSSALQSVALADLHNDVLLKEKASVYIKQHLSEIIQQDVWKSFSSDHPKLLKNFLGLE